MSIYMLTNSKPQIVFVMLSPLCVFVAGAGGNGEQWVSARVVWWVSGRVSGRVSESVCKWVSRWVSESVGGLVNE